MTPSPLYAGTNACADADANQRVAFISERLRSDAKDARRWRWGWGLAYATLALAQVGLASTRDDPGERAELYLGASKSTLGLFPIVFVPVPAIRDTNTLDQRIAAVGPGQPRCALASEAAVLLRRSADDEAFARGWLAHVLTVAVNAGGLLIMGLGYDRWATGAAGALVGVAVGELQIFTRPTGALQADRAASGWAVQPLLDGGQIGLRLAGNLAF